MLISGPDSKTDVLKDRVGCTHELLDERATGSPGDLAYRFLTDGEENEALLTYGELAHLARAEAMALLDAGATGKPVLLIRPPGLEFIIGLFASWYAGAIVVPAYPPRGSRHRKRLDAIIQDSGATLALAAREQGAIPGIQLIATGTGNEATGPFPEVRPEAPCLLQYTSGSTASPKGVMISHANLRGHFESILARKDPRFLSLVSWLPPYHDMGLVLKILYAFELKTPLTFFTPEHFIQRPARWLRAISRYRGEMSGAPNFAYELCLRSIKDEDLAGVDLSCWKSATCGAERIRPETLRRFAEKFAAWGFRKESFVPGYGLAETTLIVTATASNEFPKISTSKVEQGLVSNGRPFPGIHLRIADPETGRTCADGDTGEIRVKGPAVSSGYWKRPAETSAMFSDTGELLTGDLGYIEDGELYVTGRIKDLIIIDGTNHSPEDLESILLSTVTGVVAAAAFASDRNAKESVVIAAEVERSEEEGAKMLCAEIRRTIGDALEIPVGAVSLVRPGLLPRTTSGKIRRSACREAFEADALQSWFTSAAPAATSDGSGMDENATCIVEIIREITGLHARPEDDLVELGLSSIDMTRLAASLQEKTGAAIPIGELFAARSIAEIGALVPSYWHLSAPLPGIVASSGIDGNVMTHSQERMWFLHQLEPESAAYHVFGALELDGPLDFPAMESSVRAVISRHDILCSRHGHEDGKARIWIEPNAPVSIARHRATDDADLQSWLERFAREPFSLATDSPIRVCLVSRGGERHVFGICVHHIVADGWSMRILAREIATAYEAYRSGSGDFPMERTHGYLDYAVSHRAWVDSGAVDEQISYWKSRLEGHSGILQLSTDFPRPAKPSSRGGAVERTLPESVIGSVADLAKSFRGTPFMVHLAIYLLLLRKHGAGDDPVVAIPVANRNHAAAGHIIGTLVNTLPFRVELKPGETFLELLERIRVATFEMQAAQDAPFEKIIDAVKPDRSLDHSPLAQVMFDHQEIPIAETWAGGLTCRPHITHRGAVQFDLSLLLTVVGERQQISVEYRTDLFAAATATAMLDRYMEILAQALAGPETPVSAITGLTRPDSDFLASSSQGPVRPDFPLQTAPALIATRTARHPDRLAITSGRDSFNYQQLDARAGQIASGLRSRGVTAGDRVAILLERNLDLPSAILAIWKIGAAYVPLDAANPPDRLRLILEDQHPVHLLVSGEAGSLLPDLPAIRIEELENVDREEVPSHNTRPSDPAYVIYTSGSTGKPKGVVVSHGALANFLLSMAETPGFTEADRLLAVTTISFDISTLEIFLPLVTGGNLDLVSSEVARDGLALLKRLSSTQASVMQATPATWRMLMDAGWKGSDDLKILCGGEAMDLPLAKELVRLGGQVWNLYGPTETTVWSSLWRVLADPDKIRIGTPIANTGIHVLAADGSPQPPGVTGELWISGSGLAEGYWNLPELTARKFVTDPDGLRRYHTGDLARWDSDESLECLGRSDGQVKIRGFRVELGEIESAIANHPQVAQAKVAFRGADPTSKTLVAWVTPTGSPESVDITELRGFLATRLPSYMLPADIGVIGEFPLGSSGKVDVSKLPSPETATRDHTPMSRTEERLAEIWKELLKKPAIHRDADWFHSGGHSLLALRLFSRIRQDFCRTLPLSAILEHSTLHSLAARIDETALDPES